MLKAEKAEGPVRFNLQKLKDPDTKLKYEVETHNRFEALLEDWSNEIWEDMKKIYIECAENILGRKERKKSKPYISEDIKKLAMEKKKARNQNEREEYKRLKREIRKQIRNEKREWLERECAKITVANEHHKSREIFEQISKVKGKSMHIQSQSIKNKEGKTLTEKEEILGRWHSYGKELFDTVETKTNSYRDSFEPEPKPLFEEVESAIKQLKKKNRIFSTTSQGNCSRLQGNQVIMHYTIYVTRYGRLVNGPKTGSCRNL